MPPPSKCYCILLPCHIIATHGILCNCILIDTNYLCGYDIVHITCKVFGRMFMFFISSIAIMASKSPGHAQDHLDLPPHFVQYKLLASFSISSSPISSTPTTVGCIGIFYPTILCTILILEAFSASTLDVDAWLRTSL